MAITIPRPASTEYAPRHAGYVARVPEGADVLPLLERQGEETMALLGGVSEERSRNRYADGKRSVREVLGHLNDSERVFTYRALRFARGGFPVTVRGLLYVIAGHERYHVAILRERYGL